MCPRRRRVIARNEASPFPYLEARCAHEGARSRSLGVFSECAFLVAFFAVISCAHGGVNVEDVPGVYRLEVYDRLRCPATLTVESMGGLKAKLTTADSKCNTGEIVMDENPNPSEGNNITQFLIETGQNIVGTIVMGNVTTGVSCARGFASDQVSQGHKLNFVRPRQTLRFPPNGGNLYLKGQYYVVLHWSCVYYRVSADPGSTISPSAPSPTRKPSEQNGVKGDSNVPVTQGRANAPLNPWPWAGPLIAIGVLAFVVIIALFVVRRKRQFGLDGESSENAFFGSLASSPRRSMHDALARDSSGIVFEAASEESPKTKELPGPPSGLSELSD